MFLCRSSSCCIYIYLGRTPGVSFQWENVEFLLWLHGINNPHGTFAATLQLKNMDIFLYFELFTQWTVTRWESRQEASTRQPTSLLWQKLLPNTCKSWIKETFYSFFRRLRQKTADRFWCVLSEACRSFWSVPVSQGDAPALWQNHKHKIFVSAV